MKITVRLFAMARQTVGHEQLELELPDLATVAQLRVRLGEAFPELERLAAQSMFAIDTQYATDEQIIPAGAVVAWIPPVSGG